MEILQLKSTATKMKYSNGFNIRSESPKNNKQKNQHNI